jgi:hypothetical protein
MTIDSKWLPAIPGTDRHVFFRAGFELDRRTAVTFRIWGAHWFKVWLNGDYLAEGPLRFCETNPEYEVFERTLEPGNHVLAWHVHQMNIDTRLTGTGVIPCVHASVLDPDGKGINLDWKAVETGAWRATGRRLGCVLGWVEWCDRRKVPADWKSVGFSDADWAAPDDVAVPCVSFQETRLGKLRRPTCAGALIGNGALVNMSTIDHDPTSGFFIRELEHFSLPTQGRWWRYDLGRVRLGYPVLKVRTQPGTIIQVAYAESLTFGRVHPYLKTGGGQDSCMLDHWVTAGGEEELIPLHPKGARFIEIHMIGTATELDDFSFEDRVYFSEESEGAFSCGDELLDRAWAVGRDTFVACSEDSVTDNPHRERGQWLGEVEAPCIEMISACYSDWRILRRSIEQAALCASPAGILPAVYPGTRDCIIPSFAIQWVKAMLDYVRHTGDRSLLEPLHAAAEKNLEAFWPDVSETGLRVNPTYWNFIDWGYRGANTVFLNGAKDAAAADPALSLFYLEALEAMFLWSEWIGKPTDTWLERSEQMRKHMLRMVEKTERAGTWDAYGYHATTLSLRCGLVTKTGEAVEFLKKFLLGCFPNDASAPRLADVTVEEERVMTPYFAHFSFPALAEHGEVDFVFNQIRTCWGWMLDQGWTTWPEMFDPRWSHCHYWSSIPTWMLTRCGLGLTPAFDRGAGHYDWTFQPGTLKHAKGRIPLPSLDGSNPGQIDISWEEQPDKSPLYRIQSPVPLQIRHAKFEEAIPENTKCQFIIGSDNQEWTRISL